MAGGGAVWAAAVTNETFVEFSVGFRSASRYSDDNLSFSEEPTVRIILALPDAHNTQKMQRGREI